VTAEREPVGVVPLLMAELAVRALHVPAGNPAAVLAPPRWVDPDVDGAARLIAATSRSLATHPAALPDVTVDDPVPGRLAAVPASARTLPSGSLTAAQLVANDEPALQAILTPARPLTIDPAARAMLEQLPLEAQRVTSSAWGRNGNERAAAAFAHRLVEFVDGLTHGVTIVKPSSGSYTLASQNSPLPITVKNNLPWPVNVRVSVAATNGLPGFSTKAKTQSVEAHQKATFKLSTNVDRAGRIRVTAALYTPDGERRIGDSVEMTVRSTVLGVIGVIITIVAAAVLLLALVVRFGRRLRRRWRRDAPDGPPWDPDASDVGQSLAPTPSRAPNDLRTTPEPVEREPVERAP
jgi:hypothetical protein